MAFKFSPNFIIHWCSEYYEHHFAKENTKAPRFGTRCPKPDSIWVVDASFFLSLCSVYSPFYFNHLFFSEKKKWSYALLNHLSVVGMLRQDVQLLNIGPLCWYIFLTLTNWSKLSLWSAIFQISPDTPEQRRVTGKGCGSDLMQHMAFWLGSGCGFLRHSHPCYSLHWDSKNCCGNHTFPSKPISF